VLLDAGSIPAASTKNEKPPSRIGWFFIFAADHEIEPAGRGAKAGFRRACSPLPQRIRACKREDREIPAASSNIETPPFSLGLFLA
jgi:hypothetical protein